MAEKKDFVLKDSEDAKTLTRNNHYVPQWYQKGFLGQATKLQYLNLSPDTITLEDGRSFTHNALKIWEPVRCFFEYDLYTTMFGPFISDLIERKLFGDIDATGSAAVKAFIDGDFAAHHDHFLNFFKYIDAQKTRTPKGLTWLKERYDDLDQVALMRELQAIQQMNVTMWLEGTREIVSAKDSPVKFIISDHPVTVYNYACPPSAAECAYPNDPSTALKASQTVFPLDRDHCLILTNYEFANDPEIKDPKAKRTNARNFGQTMTRTNALLRDRHLSEKQVLEINYLIKQRAARYIAAEKKEWLYPESQLTIDWSDLKKTLLPPKNKVYEFGGEMFWGTRDGKTYSQDAFGRTAGDTSYLNKPLPKGKIKANQPCPCGQGRKYNNCCQSQPISKRPAWNVYSIRERNLLLVEQIMQILGFNSGKDWEDFRRAITEDQVRDIYQAVADLWPVDTDILGLLPKSDGKIRAVYSGMIDYRTIPQFLISSTLYFDEVIIAHPFTNPNGMNPEYSPIENPGEFKEQIIKLVALVFSLRPFIATGKINMIPDPGNFNQHLRFQSIDSAKNRVAGLNINEEEWESLSELRKEDQERMLYNLPREQKRIQLKNSFPTANDGFIDRMIEYMNKKRLADPMCILQDDLYVDGGQMNISTMGPTFEISMFLAQITGGFLLTDSPTRWQEFLNGKSHSQTKVSGDFEQLTTAIENIGMPFNYLPDVVIELWRGGKFEEVRKIWQRIYETVSNASKALDSQLERELEDELMKANEQARKDISALPITDPELNPKKYAFEAKFTVVIPKDGFSDRNVLRFLLTSGLDDYAKRIPMAIFMERMS
ncbi:DUF4238 domain-containing protein [Pedobacter paludis]|uniref:DUF4238 domain-containing protein n=1 Tax=Pedobacter paludis TaxID=2203212 RepID=A0A317F2F9_9SPHI|nr:DUF4238 domain-containing protein [Pedobacter paludis]PWS33354.1 hypothetical protein DF947_01635 [Pedobacter paludis]